MGATALVVALAGGVAGHAAAQEHDGHAGHSRHAHGNPAERSGSDHADHSTHSTHSEHSGHMGHTPPDHSGSAGHSAHDARSTPLPALTDADRAAAFPVLHHDGMQHPDGPVGYLAFNRLEARNGDHGRGQAWEASGWYGGDIHRLWLRSEGERSAGRTSSASLELLYGRSVSAWWDVVAGVRHDFAPGRSQDWLALGVQGLAPYLVEVSATAYLGGSGRSRLELEAEYDLLLTNRLILQPMFEASLHGKADPARGVGSGLSTAEAGLRLRYEIHRRFAPYVGVVHERSFGETARMRAVAGGRERDTHVVAGIRFWF